MINYTQEVRECIAENLGFKLDQVQPSDNLAEDLGMDDIDMVELTLALEEKYSIEIPDEDAETFHTVQNVIDYIQKKKEPSNGK